MHTRDSDTAKAPATGIVYPWIEPTSAKRDGRYCVTATGLIRVQHTFDRRERDLLTTNEHPQLVDMVRRVKRAHGDAPSGVFYINEWRHVLVKAGGGTWYAGSYDPDLTFDLDGGTISGRAPSWLSPGGPWAGIRTGVKYTLNAPGDDVYCMRRTSATRERSEYLSDYVRSAHDFIRSWSPLKPGGGAVYINESRELFGPVGRDGGIWLYFGYAGLDKWFPTPAVPF